MTADLPLSTSRMRKIVCISLTLILTLACKGSGSDYKNLVKSQLEFNRQATGRMLDEIEKTGKADEILAWRAGPGRAPIGWQLMHFASTEDRMAKTFGANALVSEPWSEEFKSGKPAGNKVPSLTEIRKYMADSRASLDKAMDGFDLARLEEKPAPDARFTFKGMFQILMWHEPHHQGQAQATLNLFKAAHKMLETAEK